MSYDFAGNDGKEAAGKRHPRGAFFFRESKYFSNFQENPYGNCGLRFEVVQFHSG